MGFFRRFVFHSPLRYVIAGMTGVALVLAYLILHGFGLLFYWMDAVSTAGAVLVLVGLLGVVSYLGAFDTVGYGFHTLAPERRYKDLYEYAAAKKKKRSRRELTFMPFINVGLVFLAVSLILRLLMER